MSFFLTVLDAFLMTRDRLASYKFLGVYDVIENFEGGKVLEGEGLG